jgi:hypothetical protein
MLGESSTTRTSFPTPVAANKRDIAALGRELSSRVGGELRLRLNSNRRTLVSYKRLRAERVGASRPLVVSIHHSFLGASGETLDAVAAFLRGEETTASRGVMRRFMNGVVEHAERDEVLAARQAIVREETPRQVDLFERADPPVPVDAELVPLRKRLPPLPPSPDGLNAAGRLRDLRAIADRLNYAYFEGECPVHITWGQPGQPKGRRRRTILFGTYSRREHLVRIHPRLDEPDIPDYFVEYVVYHEMLHKAEPPVTLPSGRRDVHTRAFKSRERRFVKYREARVFERRFVKELM